MKKTLLHTDKIEFNGLTILHLVKSRLKHSYVSVAKDGEIKLKTPKVSPEYIEKILLQKEEWIRKQLLKIEQNPQIQIRLEDEVLLFGEIYSVDSDEAKELKASLHRLRKPNETNILRCYDNYYKSYGENYLTQRVIEWAETMELSYSEIKFKKMKRRWGSCSTTRVITLNTQLMKLKKEQIDFVVVHELAHLVHMNHSKKFHSLVENYMVDATDIKKEMRLLSIL